MQVTARSNGPLIITEIPAASATVRRGATLQEPVLPPEFLKIDKVTIEKSYQISLDPTAPVRRGEELPAIALEAQTTGDDAPLVVLRHPSGAITFHAGIPSIRRRAAAGTLYQFRIPLRQSLTSEGQRGLVTSVFKAVVLKVSKPVIDAALSFALPKLARIWEERTWSGKGIAEGWFHVTPSAGGGPLELEPGTPDPAQRNLVLIHGTFSDAASAFGGLTKTDFFKQTASLYANRIYAFNHFSVSKSPQDNVDALLSGLPDTKHLCDVITHSRGGLVLRTIVERAADFGPMASRFQLGRAVLVASPNDGTPLIGPDRWDKTIGWIANLLKIIEHFTPDNPFLTGAEFVAEGIVWLAHHVSGDLPGLRSMDRGGETIEALQGPPTPPAHAYSALVANFQPDRNILQTMVDAGVDQFFDSANDLVVPTEGGWRIDRDGIEHIDRESVGCFGPGGNLAPGEPAAVMHTSFFHRTETAVFLERALKGQPQNLPALNVEAPLPDRRFVRAATAAAFSGPQVQPKTRISGPQEAPGPSAFNLPTTAARDTFHIVILQVADTENEPAASGARAKRSSSKPRALIYAAYGGARVVEEFELRGGTIGEYWERIIDIHGRIKKFTDEQQGTLPADAEMDLLGRLLFRVMFPGDVKRLYDTARSLQGRRRLDIVFTSMVSWVAEKPWEFAYDPGRNTYLATEEIHFVRNVLTQVPGDAGEPTPGPLRVLIVSAQPVGTVELSIDEETEMIRRDFSALTDAGLARVEVLPRATIAALHGALSIGGYNVVHFIGHGVFREESNQGFLLFQGQPGAPPEFLDERSARELFCGRGIGLLFLNACQTSTSSPADFNRGLAQSLVAHGLPALVANQYSVGDTAATSFSQFFYWGLARGLSLGAAAREARISVNYSLNGPAIDWAVPVLYARDPNSTLTTGVSGVPAVMPVGAGPATARIAALEHPFRIAVWDVDRALPDLPGILDRLSRAQKRFGFELVNLSAPLDAFKTIDGVRYLWKERVAERLRGRVGELRANALLCLTHYPLSDDDGYRPYAWWPSDLKSPILIFSYAGLDLDPRNPETPRALVNAIVRAMAATQARLVLHDKPPVSCPMYLNRERDVRKMSAVQKFGPECRDKINDPGVLADLEALLAAVGATPSRSAPAPRKRTRKK
jgi:hypothetical protein